MTSLKVEIAEVCRLLNLYKKSIKEEYPIKCKEALNKLIIFWNNITTKTPIEEYHHIKEYNSIITGYEVITNNEVNNEWGKYLIKNSSIRVLLAKN